MVKPSPETVTCSVVIAEPSNLLNILKLN